MHKYIMYFIFSPCTIFCSIVLYALCTMSPRGVEIQINTSMMMSYVLSE